MGREKKEKGSFDYEWQNSACRICIRIDKQALELINSSSKFVEITFIMINMTRFLCNDKRSVDLEYISI